MTEKKSEILKKADELCEEERCEEAEEMYMRAYKTHLAEGEKGFAARGIFKAGMCRNCESYVKGKECMEEALALEPDNVQYLNGLAKMHYGLGEELEAIDCFEKALKRIRDGHGTEGITEAKTLSNLGSCWSEIGDLDKAEKYYLESREAHERKGEQADSVFFNNMGNLYKRKGNYKKATEYLDRALAMEEAREEKDLETIAVRHNNIAHVHMKLERYDDAEEHFKKALELFEKENGKGSNMVRVARGSLAYVYGLMEEHEMAVQTCEKVVADFDEYERAEWYAPALDRMDLGEARRMVGDNEGALGDFETAREMLEARRPDQRGGEHLLGRLYHNMFYALSDLGDLESAFTFISRAYDHVAKKPDHDREYLERIASEMEMTAELLKNEEPEGS